ncbi:hypothetical protein FB45DRAFT_869313 [Roridomyces roridus]|uniref:Uncharacterized protein n=1 Tax=Roridomyces roridus TaxID=1738132 RepID=A0AAD7BKX3_9AGAR|nr:hypothetical protein FB45DRAFT_869313 [Roridomyces roridus]
MCRILVAAKISPTTLQWSSARERAARGYHDLGLSRVGNSQIFHSPSSGIWNRLPVPLFHIAVAENGKMRVPDPRLTGIPDKDDRSKNDRNSGTKDSGEGRKVGGGRWSPTGDITKTQGDRVPYATSKGSNLDETIKEERRAWSSQGRIDQEH